MPPIGPPVPIPPGMIITVAKLTVFERIYLLQLPFRLAAVEGAEHITGNLEFSRLFAVVRELDFARKVNARIAIAILLECIGRAPLLYLALFHLQIHRSRQ